MALTGQGCCRPKSRLFHAKRLLSCYPLHDFPLFQALPGALSAETRILTGGDDSAVGLRKTRCPRSTATDVITTLMHKPVVMAAKQHQVIQLRFAAIRPVDDMMRVNVALRGAARKSTAVVTVLQSPAQSRCDVARTAANIEGVSASILQPVHHPTIAGLPPGRFRWRRPGPAADVHPAPE